MHSRVLLTAEEKFLMGMGERRRKQTKNKTWNKTKSEREFCLVTFIFSAAYNPCWIVFSELWSHDCLMKHRFFLTEPPSQIVLSKIHLLGLEKIQLMTTGSFPEDPDSIPSTYTKASNNLSPVLESEGDTYAFSV